MDFPIFDPRDSRYKQPFGAVPCAAEVTLTLRPPASERFQRCTLIAYGEFANEHRSFPLAKIGSDVDHTIFSGSYKVFSEPELIWYSFRFERVDGSVAYLGKNGYCGEGEAVCWQQTVYDDTYKTPDWFGRGVTYQIFPDRFYRTSIPDPAGMTGDRVVHQHWNELMEYLPDENGIIHNRDFFGGNLAGIIEKLDYLDSLGVTTLYLCPIFEADSNHRYNTGDYEKIDPMLGTEEDFKKLCKEAHKRGMRVMLDGVFNHTGNNSRYFNALGQYPTLGAAQSKDSPYYDWYHFHNWPTTYDSWWGIHTLPAVNESHSSYIDYIIENEKSIIRRWLRAGADAWRLDVADELPDDFIRRIRTAMMEEKADSFLLGEVWEDGSNKVAYSQRRKYLLGHETHGLMNYPFRVSAMDYLRGGDARWFMESMETIRENYPPEAFHSCMNMLGTHDNPRILTMLGTFPNEAPPTRTERAEYRMTDGEKFRGWRLLGIGAIILYCFPGSPTIFYGDEAGMEGYEDPFNRGTFPWGEEDPLLQKHFSQLGKLRNARRSLQCGSLRWLLAEEHTLAFEREYEDEVTVAITNVGDEDAVVSVDWSGDLATDALTGQQFLVQNGKVTMKLAALDGVILI
ncbi:MAG: alpha-glucosidase C-terminal domain-containing protein [Oscillospiraceae bacterium]|nr:alpha-glucosidase C-terminal domain-containing protein [Oscillospiraceae bacterium]